VIYLIKSGHLTKIGTTTNLARRLGMLQTGNPKRLLVLAVGHGGEKEERFLHLRFKALRVHGEWFALSWWHIGFIVCLLKAKCHTKYATRCALAYRALFWVKVF
jgi:hypothetical protein